jgi:large subunit ribosomal protein L31
MKDKIHPEYYEKAEVTCSCGNTFSVGATKEKIKVEVCSACHPFYTGKKKILDTMGRVEKFKQKMAKKKK